MGTAEGVVKTAATRAGITVDEYKAKVEAGELRCTRCKTWHPADAFAVDRSRARGRAASCRESNSHHARTRYEPKERERGRRFVTARDGDQKQARRRVNYLVELGEIPNPNDVPCTDCGHHGAGPRHEYDHHLGYDADHHEDVESVCAPCHHRREDLRREQ